VNRVQKYRNKLAELGCEATPEEANKYLKVVSKLSNSISYEDYLVYSTLTDDDISKIAIKAKMSYNKVKEYCNIMVHAGALKYEV
jgi:hypothetical protein